MNKKQKKRLEKNFKIIWFIAGAILAIITIFAFIRTRSGGTLNEALFFAVNLYSLTIYITITLILVLVQEIIKRFKEFQIVR